MAVSGVREAARLRAWSGLGDARRAPAWWRGSSEQRLAVLAGLVAGTVLLALASVATVHGQLVPASPARPYAAGSQWQHLMAVAVVVPVPLLAGSPLVAWAAGWLALVLVPFAPASWTGGWPWGPVQILLMLAVFCLAGIRLRRPALWSLFAFTVIPWWLWLASDMANLKGPGAATVAFALATIAVDALGGRRQAEQDLAAATDRARQEQSRRAVLEERARIARELHDVVAHHMSLIAVRAETAPYRLSDLSGPVSAEFQSLSAAARDALGDMRRLLGVLRHEAQPAGLAPQPQLSDLPALVSGARLAGVPVELVLPSNVADVPAGVGVCAYRIVQESLSNASQHAPGAPVLVSVGHADGTVVLRVVNGPGGVTRSGGLRQGQGTGLVGMRERVALLGGSLSAGPAADGGFVVSAILPVSAAA